MPADASGVVALWLSPSVELIVFDTLTGNTFSTAAAATSTD
jgi:hypothetical protein